MSDDKSPAKPSDVAATNPDGSIVCPWCSTEAPAGAERCASCGAALVSMGDATVPGLTAIDAESLLRSQSLVRQRSGRLLPFGLGGDDGERIEVPSEAELASLAPPTSEVQMEIVKLELDAERQRLENARAALESEVAELAREAGETGERSPMAAPADTAPADTAPADTAPADAPPGPEAGAPDLPPPGPDAAAEGEPPAG